MRKSLILIGLIAASFTQASQVTTTFAPDGTPRHTLHAPLTMSLDSSGKSTTTSSAPAGTQVVLKLHSASGKVYTFTAKQPATFTVTSDGVWTVDASY